MYKSKSCFELSDADNSNKKRKDAATFNDDEGLIETSLWLPPMPDGGGDNSDDDDKPQRLRLPTGSPCNASTTPRSLDEYLSKIPKIASRSKLLLESLPPENEGTKRKEKRKTKNSNKEEDYWCGAPLHKSKSCLNVLQGELAHASPSDADIVVSADATTCHVVALRSTKSESVPLVSLAHVDEAGTYDSCFEAMIQEHIFHHARHSSNPDLAAALAEKGKGRRKAAVESSTQGDDDDFDFFWDDDDSSFQPIGDSNSVSQQSFNPYDRNNSSSSILLDHSTQRNDSIDMELHLMGGYLDEGGTSQEISTSLVTTFSELADKYRHKLRMSLSTAAISCMNTETSTSTSARPKSRGLAIDTRTGEVFPVKSVPKQYEGPAIDVRNARGFAQTPSGMKKSLSVIHDTKHSGGGKGEIRIEPFHYEPRKNLDVLLNVPDDVLLKVASTSPECESENFCTNLRKSISFINTVPSECVFGSSSRVSTGAAAAISEQPQPLVYSRSSVDLNKWERVNQWTSQ